jgi:serine/threonine protein kinase
MSTTVPAFLAKGAKVGSFEIDTFLGGGACAKIYRATSSLSGRKTVIKIFDEHFSSHAFYSMIMLSEVDRASNATSPYVANVLEAGFAQGKLYMAMDLVEGETLWDFILRYRRLKAYDVLDYGVDIASGLDWMERELHHLHKDIKPSNIMISKGRAILIDLDFDTLKISGSDENMVWGTPEYLAPELLRQTHKPDRRSDMYALGCTLYHALTGQPPFWHLRTKDSTPQEIANLHVTGEIKAPSVLVPGLPKKAESVLLACLARRPSQRPATYVELIERFREAQNECMVMEI